MKLTRLVMLTVFLAGVAFSGVGCRKETKMEKLQRKAKEAAEKTSEAVEEAVED